MWFLESSGSLTWHYNWILEPSLYRLSFRRPGKLEHILRNFRLAITWVELKQLQVSASCNSELSSECYPLERWAPKRVAVTTLLEKSPEEGK